MEGGDKRAGIMAFHYHMGKKRGNRTRKKMKACVWFFGMISKINELDTDKTVYRR